MNKQKIGEEDGLLRKKNNHENTEIQYFKTVK